MDEKLPSPFTIMGDMMKKKEHPREVVEKVLNSFLLISYLRNNSTTVYVAEYLNQNHHMKIYEMYAFCLSILPKQVSYIKWIKPEKDYTSEDVELIMLEYNVSKEVALMYHGLLNSDTMEKIRKRHSTGGVNKQTKTTK